MSQLPTLARSLPSRRKDMPVCESGTYSPAAYECLSRVTTQGNKNSPTCSCQGRADALPGEEPVKVSKKEHVQQIFASVIHEIVSEMHHIGEQK